MSSLPIRDTEKDHLLTPQNAALIIIRRKECARKERI